MQELKSLGGRRLRRSAALLIPATVLLLGTAGVAARPLYELRSAQSEVDRALADLERVELEADRNRALRALGGLERVDAALVAVRAWLPAGVTSVELHAALRLVAELHGIELEHLELRAPVDPGLGGKDVALARPAVLAGRAEPNRFFDALDTFEGLGLPVVVRELSLERVPGDRRFALRAELWLYVREAGADPNSSRDQGRGTGTP